MSGDFLSEEVISARAKFSGGVDCAPPTSAQTQDVPGLPIASMLMLVGKINFLAGSMVGLLMLASAAVSPNEASPWSVGVAVGLVVEAIVGGLLICGIASIVENLVAIRYHLIAK